MAGSVALKLNAAEVKRLHREGSADSAAVKNLHRVDADWIRVKARVGAAVQRAIGSQPLKKFGHEGLMSEVCAGTKVPDYLVRIYKDDNARRRFALAWLEDDAGVVMNLTITLPNP